MTLTEKIFILKSIPPFNTLSDSELILTANVVQTKTFEDKSLIYTNGGTLHYLFILTDGKMVNDKNEKINNFFGFSELINDEVINDDIYALGKVTMFLISKAHLLTLLYETPSIMIEFLSLKQGKNV